MLGVAALAAAGIYALLRSYPLAAKACCAPLIAHFAWYSIAGAVVRVKREDMFARHREPRRQIPVLNEQIRAYAREAGVTYLDLFRVFRDEDHGIRPELTRDGVHLSPEGYAVMEPMVEEVLGTLLVNRVPLSEPARLPPQRLPSPWTEAATEVDVRPSRARQAPGVPRIMASRACSLESWPSQKRAMVPMCSSAPTSA